jgi:hypothetical protein
MRYLSVTYKVPFFSVGEGVLQISRMEIVELLISYITICNKYLLYACNHTYKRLTVCVQI